MEAVLIPIYGPALPDDWRTCRFPSFRRLLVIVRHLPEDSPIARVERGDHPYWPPEAELLDSIRRDAIAIAHAKAGNTTPYPAPHPLSPEARRSKVRADEMERRREHARAREAARQERLRQRREGGLHQ